MTRQGRLLYDSAGVDGVDSVFADPTAARELLYRSGPINIDLVVATGPGRLRVFHGHVTRRDAGAPVARAAIRVGAAEQEVTTDELGHFSFGSLCAGTSDMLEVRTDTARVVCSIPPAE